MATEKPPRTPNEQGRSSTPVTADEFFTGLFAALALKGRPSLSIRVDRFDQILADLFEELASRSKEAGVDLRFRIRPHRIYGDSPTVRAAVSAAVQADLISRDNPTYQDIRFQMGPEDAEYYLGKLPISREIFVELADAFLDQYDSPVDSTAA